MREIIAENLATIIRDSLMKDGEITIQGLGTFHKKHKPAEEKAGEKGVLWMMPPRDVIHFESGEKLP